MSNRDARYARRGLALLRVLTIIAMLISPFSAVIVAQPAYAAGGSYNINWSAADPKVSNAPYLPTYAKVPPSSLACPTPSGSAGRAADPLANAVFGTPKDSVESLAPQDMALGQIVPFEVKISVSGSTAPEGGIIRFSPYWLTKTTSGDDFGYNPAYKVYCAFVDTADAAKIDPDNNAKVDLWTDTVANVGTNNEQIQGTIQVSGLNDGDSVIVEIWVVLKNTIPARSSGNVQTGLLSAQTASGDTINTGNQTVPLLQVGDFFKAVADVSVTKSDSPDPVTQGQQLTYDIVVTNNSTSIVANGVVATDKLDPNTTFISASGASCSASGQTVTCDVGALSPLQAVTIRLIVNVSATAPTAGTMQRGACTVGQAGVDLCNQVSVSAITDDKVTTNNSASQPTNVLPALVPNPQLNLTKSASPATYNKVGDIITYSYVLKNVGNVPLSAPYAVTDNKVSVTCPQTPNPLPVGESITCLASYAVTQADLDTGLITNTATATASYGASTVTSNQAQATVTAVQNPALNLTKTASPPTYDAAGQTISYSYEVKNSGNVTLSGPFAVTDNKTTVSCPTTASLAPGASITCSASHLVTQADLDAGSITNDASATASFGGNTVTSNPAEATVNAIWSPALTLTKSASPTTYNTLGQAISYSYEVKNTGNVTLSGPFTVTDDKATVTCPGTASLTPGGTITCSATYKVTQADLDSGSVINWATATNGTVTSNEATATITAQQSPALALKKTASPENYDTVDQSISYSYEVKNSGNVTLAGPFSVTDDKATVSCPATASLAPAAFIICTASYKVTQADLDASKVTNAATASNGTVTSNQATATVYAIAHPNLALVKSASPGTFSQVGDSISYGYVLTNIGNVALSAPYAVTDDKASVTCPQTPNPLPVGTWITCDAAYAVTQADLDAGSVTNHASATATYGGNSVASNPAQATVNAVQTRVLVIDKVAQEKTYVKAGDVLHYDYKVTNAGNVTLHDAIVVTDDKATVSCPALPEGGLAPNAFITCSASYVVKQADLDAGAVTNIAYATSGTTTSPTDTVTVPATQSPAFDLAKSADPVVYSAVDQIINYSYIIANTGNVTLAGPFTVDDNKATVTCDTAESLAPGLSLNCSATYKVTQADLDSGSVTNTAKAHAYFNGSQGTSNEATATVIAEQKPALKLTKSASPLNYEAVGQTISYSYLLENSGNVTLAGPFTVDDNKATVSCPATTSLAPGGTIICSASYVVTQADLDSGSVTNTATAHASFGSKTIDSNEAQATVNAIPRPDLGLVKSADLLTYDHVGQLISYSYVVKNIGNVTLIGPLTVDDNKATVSCPALPEGGLAPNALITCSASYAVTQADLDAGAVTNIAIGHAQTIGGMPVNSNNDSATVNAVQTRVLVIDKVAQEKTYVKVGDVLHYDYKVTNAGNMTLHDAIVVTDDKATVSCPALPEGGLAPNAFITCSASYAVKQADLDAGAVTNIASATDGTTTSPTDTVTVPATQSPAIDLAKTASTINMTVAGPTDRADAGDKITYSFVIKNTGNVTLNTVKLDDALVGFNGASCDDTDGQLAPNETASCTAVYALTQTDIDAGSVTNSATAYGNPPQGNPVTDSAGTTTTIPQVPALSVAKDSTTKEVTAAGEVVLYSYVIKNIGNVTLTGVTLSDDNVEADPVCTLALPASLMQAPVAGIALNRYVYLPTITLGGSGAGGAGSDTRAAVANAVYSVQDGLSLAPGQSASCTAKHTVTQAEMDAGKVNNIATADSDQTAEVKDDLSIPASQSLALSLDKTASPATYDAVGQKISYSYLVTNNGNVTLAGPFTVSDDKSTDESCPATSSLAPGASITCSASYTIKQSDLDAGSVKNTAKASAQFGGKPVTSNEDSETVKATQKPALTLTKSANPTIYSYPGQVIVYTYVLKNTGNVTLNSPFAISDDKLGAFPCGTVTSLAPGASTSCTKSYTIQPGDLNATNNASITNKAMATGKDPMGKTVTSNEATAMIQQVASTGQLAPTATTCQMFRDGTAGNLTTLQYGVKGNAINNVAPGVMFYYSKITAPAASFPIQVMQSNNKIWKPMGIQDTGQVIVWDANCVKSNATATYTSSNGTVSIQVNGAKVGAVYYLSIKYNPGSLVGQKVSKPYPTASYTFKTILNGAEIITSWDSVNVTPK